MENLTLVAMDINNPDACWVF